MNNGRTKQHLQSRELNPGLAFSENSRRVLIQFRGDDPKKRASLHGYLNTLRPALQRNFSMETSSAGACHCVPQRRPLARECVFTQSNARSETRENSATSRIRQVDGGAISSSPSRSVDLRRYRNFRRAMETVVIRLVLRAPFAGFSATNKAMSSSCANENLVCVSRAFVPQKPTNESFLHDKYRPSGLISERFLSFHALLVHSCW